MSKIKLKSCPFCGGEAKLEEYYETCDGRGDRHAKITCLSCLLTMRLTFDEFEEVKKVFKYKGGYYSQNKKFWNGMHKKLVEKWNTRKPMQEIVERLEEEKVNIVEGCRYDVDLNTTINRAIEIVKEVGGMND